jgi:general stress protein YciG
MKNDSSVVSSQDGGVQEAATSDKKKRGFAAMDPALAQEISRRGGVAAHRAGTAHEFSSAEARVAGRKGGVAARQARGRALDAEPEPNDRPE